MPQISLSGQDTVQLAGRNFTAFCDGDFASLTYPNESVAMKTGKNGNTIYALDFRGQNGDFALRLIRGSQDDKFLLAQYTAQQTDFPSFTLISGQYVKRVGQGNGVVVNDTQKLFGGIIAKRVEAKSNAEGETEQSLAIWHLKFSDAERAIM